MGQYYEIKGAFKHSGNPDLEKFENWLHENIEGSDFDDAGEFSCWGDNPYGFEDDLLDQLMKIGQLEYAKVDCYTSDDGVKRFIWDARRKQWDVIPGRVCFVSEDSKAQFLGDVIGAFEDFLEEKGITIPNPERDETSEDNQAIIYGSDYGYLQDRIEPVMKSWGYF